MTAATQLARLLVLARHHELRIEDAARVRAIASSGQITQEDAAFIEALWERMQ